MGLMAELKEKRKKTEDTEKKEKAGSLISELQERKKYLSIDTNGVDDNYIKSFISDANNFLSTAKEEYGKVDWGTASSAYDTRSNALKDLSTRYDTIKAWLFKNRDKTDEEYYKSMNAALDSFKNGASSVVDTFKNASDYYSQWATEDDYKRHYALAISPKESADFEQYSQVGASINNPSFEDARIDKHNIWERLFKDEIKNPVTFGRENVEKLAIRAGSAGNSGDVAAVENYYRYKNMTDDQVDIYNYYLGKGEREKAEEYLEYINDFLNQERGKEIAKNVEKTKLGEVFFSVSAGLESFAAGIGNLDNYLKGAEADPTTATQYAYQQTSGNNEGFFKVINDFGYTTGNMLPSILVGSVTGGVGGSLTMGVSAGGNAYAEMRNLGYTDWQSRGYATLIGASEAALQSVLGGIGNLGGKHSLSAGINKLVSGLDSAIGRIAIKVPMNMASEGLEEAIQTVLESAFKALVTGEEYEAAEWSDILYSALLGALYAGVMEGVPTIAGTAINSNRANKLYGSDAQALVTEALEIDPDNAYASRMQERLDKGKKVSGYQLNRLVEANENAMYDQDLAKMKSATETRLTELGEKGDVSKIADAIVKQASGEKLSLSEKAVIKNSKFGQRVVNEITPKNIKSGEYSSAWAENLNTERINVDEYSRLIPAESEGSAQQTEEVSMTENVPVKEIATESEIPTLASVENASESVDNSTVSVTTVDTDIAVSEKSTVSLNNASKKYGAQAQAMIHTYVVGQDVEQYDNAYRVAYDMGRSGVSLSYVKKSEATAYLTESQKELAYEAGKAATDEAAKEQDAKIKSAATGKAERKKGTVQGRDVKIEDLKKTFNDTQNIAYKILSVAAEATGINIVLYKSQANTDGDFEGAQGKFKWSDDTIYIDINAGLKNVKGVDDLAKYAMVRTFTHEFTHFIEKYNPIWYNELRKVVFEELTARGEDVNDLIEEKMALSKGMSYEKASREVVAEAMTDILPDSHFVETLANKHKNIFEKLLDKLKEFLDNIKAYFNTIGRNSSRESNSLKEQVGDAVHYVENIVKLFDKVAVEAVENYQMAVAFEEAQKIDSAVTKKAQNISNKAENKSKAEKTLFEKYDEVKQKYPDNIVLYRVGDFFEVLGEDAKAVSEWTDATLTGRNDPNTGRVDMVGFPFHKLDKYVEKIRTHQNVTLVQEENGVVKEYPMAPVKSSNGLTEDEEAALIAYKSGGSYTINAKLRDDIKLNEYEQKIVDGLDKALAKLPLYKGRVYRNISFDGFGDKAARDAFVSGHVVDDIIKYPAYTSTSTEVDGYTIAGEFVVHIEIESTNGRNVEGYGNNNEGEVLFPRNTVFVTDKIVYDQKGIPTIYLTEVANEQTTAGKRRNQKALSVDNRGQQKVSSESHETKVQRLSAQNTKNGEVRPTVSGRNTERDISGRTELQRVQTEVKSFEDVGEIEVEPSIEERERAYKKKFSNQEVIPNVENIDNGSTVQQPDTDRQRNSRILERLQTEDVSGDAQGRDSMGDSVERGQETRRDDVFDGSGTGARGRSSDGDSQSGDLRRDDELTPEAAEKLHEEVATQIVQQSTEQPKGKNFVIGDSLDLPNGEKARYKANIEAIRLVKQLEAEGRYATEAEQVTLSKYVGWGGLANAFDEKKTDWSKEFKELKELLTEEEYNLARGSTLNAHYTDISVIKAMYDGLRQLGFNGGRVMEPSSGVGNFVGAMPADMSALVKSWTMIELDGITGLIAKYLYPNADVRIQGFEKANVPNNYMDVIISNVPFGNYPITDKAYPKKVTSAIHNYFFAKSLDKVRPGGIVMFITSSYTLNSKDETVRRYIMQRADLLGAIRLPDTAFKGNAGTEVVTDILILKKRPANTAYAGENFLEAPYKYINANNGAYINTYFDAHPEMVLGTASMEGSMYRGASLTYKALEGHGSLADQISEAFKSINGKMDYPAQLSNERTNFAVERAGKQTKNDGYIAKNGKIYQNKGGELVEQNVNAKVAERIKGMLEIRDAAKVLINAQQQGLNETEVKKARTTLNKVYDAFVKKNGFINSPANRSAFNSDPDRYSLFALENWDNDKKTATKSDIFSKNTIAPNRTVNSAKDVAEGLIVSVNQTGRVDVSLIATLTGKTETDVTRELIDSRQVFKNRDGVLETAESYLSGNVRAKLRDAEALAPMDSDYQKNIESLKAVMPEDVSYQDIFVNPGTPWIPSSVYSDFAAYMLGGRNTELRQDIDVTRNSDTGNFTVELKNAYLKHNASNTQKWGTSRRSFLDLFDAMLNSKSVIIKDKLDDGSFVINKDATTAANEKIENITKEFQNWLWRDETRRTELAILYNEVFNSIVTPKYNGDNLTVNGANAMKPLRPHQRNAVQRIISSGGNTLLAHKVGAGKTYEMAAAAMKLKQLGLVRKPMFAVPKSLVAQWGTEFIDFFPTAKLLVAEATDFTTANRKVFMNRIANGEYDAVIVSYEQFEKLPVSDDFTRALYQEQINSIIAAIEEAKADKGGKSLSVKDLEKKRKSLQAKIDKLTDKAKDEDNIDFEQLGVDSLFIDEAHNFKNLFYTTSMTNVSGLGNKDGSKRAFDLYTKVRYLQKLNGGKGIVFATATPVMNSMSEMYIMQKYLQPDLLEQLGLDTFDAWAKQFGEVVNGVEIKPSGQGYRVKQSFSRFKNMSELQLLFRNFADVLTDIPGLKIPKMKGDAVNVVVCEPGQFQQDFMKELEKRGDNIKNVDPSVDNMLKITSDGRKISYTQRMIDPSLPYEEGCKIYRCADNVVKAYNDSKDIKGTQLIFCDMATPKGKSKTETTENDDAGMDMESARLYDDIKARLIEGGIHAKEIAFIHEADTDQKKKKLFADVNEGKVRVLIGSTGKMGVGMNAQKRVVAIHHLDAPWRPGDVEQRNGRAFRQGNINQEVECFTYVTEGSFDARLWDILERKQNFINQVMNGESVGREAEDTGEVTLSAAEVKALASGSPLIMEQVQLDTDIKKLESLYRAHLSSIRAARERLATDKGTIELLERMIDLGKSDMLSIKDTYSEGKFSINIGKQKFTEKKDAGVALMAEAMAKAVDSGYTSIGSFAGFEVRVIKTHEGIKGLISGKQGYSFNTYPNNTTFMVNHIISVVEGITEKVNAWRSSLEETKKDMTEQEKLITEPFAKQAELDEKRKRYNEVMEILNPKEEQSLDNVDEDTVQEQIREYLEGNENNGNLDNHSDGEGHLQKLAEKGLQQSIGNFSMADRHGNQIRNDQSGSGSGILYKDSEGVSVSREITNLLSETKIVDENGKLLAVYHATDKIFEKFTRGDIGFHFGNKMQAEKRAEKKKLESPTLVRAYLNIKKPIYSPRDTMSWKANAVSLNLWSLGIISDTELENVKKLVVKNDNDYNSKAAIYLRTLLESKGYDGIIYPNCFEGDGDSYIAFHDEQIVRADNSNEDEQNQQRTDTLTDREVLEMAANEIYVSDLTQAEKDALTIFQDRLSNLKELQEKRTEQGRLYKEQQFGSTPNRAEAEKTLNRMRTLDGQIKKATADILSVEEKEVLKRVLQKARKVVEVKERQHGQEILARWRDRRNNAADIKKYRDRLRGDVHALTNWIIGPNNKDIAKHVPDVLKNSVIPFLSSINFMSKRSLKGGDATVSDKEFIKRLEALKSAIKTNIDVYGMYSGYNDLPADFMERLETFIKSANSLLENNKGEFIINQMTSGELKELFQVVRTLKKYITQFNSFHNNAMYQHVYEAGDNSIDFLKDFDNAGSHTGGFSNFVFWQQIRPAYAFERFGEGGKAIYDGLRQGQAKLAFNTKEIESFAKKAYTAREVKAWEAEMKTFTLGGDLVKIPVSHIMSFYELTKDPEAKIHITGDGIRVATYTHKGEKISDVGHILTDGELNQIVASLTPRQLEVADSLQRYMAEQGGKWGNFVSIARFGEELFTNPNYFPINSDGRHLSSNVEEYPSAASLYALLNLSFTKSRKKGASNRIVLYSIFDVFANHMASMAQYNAMALPILDALKWFNYQQVLIDDEGNKTVVASVREQMDRVYGVPEETKPGSGKQGYAETFIINIIKDFNGTAAQGTPYDSLGLKSLHHYNIAQVAYNLRVVLQQPLAITRAGMLLSYRSILKGFKLKPSAIKKNITEMCEHSGIAAWKSLGFYDVNISRGLTHLIKHDTGFFEKIGDVGLWGAEKVDTLTWAAMWSACKEEVKKKQHLTPESDGFFESVTKLFEDVIYKTQVVDSILTKNEFMRDKGTFARLVGSFMSEPTTNASMLIDAIDKYHLDIKRGMTKRQAWQKNGRMIGRTLYVFSVGAVLLAAVQAVADAFRDDDEYEKWYEKWLEAFGGNLVDELMPFNKLPIIADFYDLTKELLSIFGVDTYGNPPQSVFMQWYDSLVKGTEIIYDKISGEDTNYTWYGGIYKLLQALSGMTGLPMASAIREIITAWNNTVGAMAPSLRVKTYESSELSKIKYAYEDGYLTEEEAVKLLLEKGLADNENEAYFIIRGWEAGDEYSKYDAILDAVRNGASIDDAMKELTSHGYSEKDVLSHVKGKVGEWYRDGEISKPQAINILTKYCDMDSEEITATVNKWSSYVVTGIKYEEIDDEFMDGNLSASRAIEMYVRYGSMTKEKATEKVTVLSFVKEHPECEGISYAAVNGYNTYCEPCGVPVKTYYEAWKYKNTLSGDVKEQMMRYINSLNLSKKQKNSLYYAFGWEESKLHEAPWH